MSEHEWNLVYSSREWGKYPYIELVRFIARNFYGRERSKIKILDVGCGTASHAWYLAKEGFDAYGIDGSDVAIGIGKKRLEEENLSAHLIAGDIEHLPYEDNSFDCVLDNECLYCNNEDKTKKIMSEIKRVLKEDGLFYSRTFSSKQDLGKGYTKINDYEFSNIADGPLAGNSYARLTDEKKIKEVYGAYFEVIAIDKLNYTDNNQSTKVYEFQIISKKVKE